MNPGRIEVGIVAALVATGFVLYGLVAIFILWIRDVRLRRLKSRKDERSHKDAGSGSTD
jgi:hypothetical protein